MTSTALVLLMIPGVGFFYSGLARRKSALSLIWLSMMSTAVVSFQVPAPPGLCAGSDSLMFLAVVLLGLFTCILPLSRQLPRKPRKYRFSQCSCPNFCWKPKDSRSFICSLPGNVLLHHVCFAVLLWVFGLSY